MLFLSDSFTFNAGDPLSGHTPELGLAWTALTGADAINYAGTKIGELNALPNISGFTCNPTVPPQADYHAQVEFVAGNNVFGMSSLGLMIRLQQTTFTGLLDFYYVRFEYQGRWHLTKVNQSGAGPGPFDFTSPMTLNPGQTYNLDIGVAGSTVTVKVDGVTIFNQTDGNPVNLTGAGHVGVLVSNQTPSFNSTDGWWFDNLIAYDGSLDAQFGLFFAGSGIATGQDFTSVVYGLPTPVIISNPVAGDEYAIQVTPVDLAGFTSGKMGNIKLRRSGADPQESGNVVLRAIAVKYKKLES